MRKLFCASGDVGAFAQGSQCIARMSEHLFLVSGPFLRNIEALYYDMSAVTEHQATVHRLVQGQATGHSMTQQRQGSGPGTCQKQEQVSEVRQAHWCPKSFAIILR